MLHLLKLHLRLANCFQQRKTDPKKSTIVKIIQKETLDWNTGSSHVMEQTNCFLT